MGLLEKSDWCAKWISFDTDSLNQDAELMLPPSPYFRKTFEVARPIRNATVYATARGLYELQLNGRKVGDERFTPGWTDYHKRIYYRSYDVTDLMQQGDNAIGAILSNGWYAGYVGFALMVELPKHRAFYGDVPELLVQLEIEYEDRQCEVVPTDETWKAAVGAIKSSDILMGEVYDARSEMPGWDQAGFDERQWQPVVFVFDMGQNMAGWAQLRVSGPAGTKVVMRHGERLTSDGMLTQKWIQSTNSFQTDEYILSGDEEEVWEPRFTYHGFQYVEVTGFPGEPTVSWCSACIHVPWSMYRYCGDTRILAQHYDTMKKYVDFVTSQSKNHLIDYNSIGDWLFFKTKTRGVVLDTTYYYADAKILAESAQILGKTADAEKYAE